MASHRRVFTFCETLLIFALLIFLFSRFLLNVDAVPFDPDESEWVHMGKFFWIFFIDKDFENPEWHEYFALTQPPVVKYLIGFALYASGHKKDEIRLGWNFGKSYHWNITHGRFPRQDHLRVARLTMGIFGGLVGVVFYFIGRKVCHLWAGLIACLLWALNPSALLFTRRAVRDGPLLFFLFSTLLINLWLVSHFCRNRPISYFKTLGLSFLAGISLFLAAGTKLNGGLGGLAFIAVMGVFLVQGCFKPGFMSGLISSGVKLIGSIPRDKIISIIYGLYLGIGGVSLIISIYYYGLYLGMGLERKVGLVLLLAFLFLTFLAVARAKITNISLPYLFEVLFRQRFFLIVTILYSISVFYFLIKGQVLFKILLFSLIVAFTLRLLTYPVFKEPLRGLKRNLSLHRLAPAALMSIILLGVVSLSLFVLSNPVVHDDPEMGIKRMLHRRSELIQVLRARYPWQSLDTLPQKVSSVYQVVFYKYDVFARIFRFPLGLILVFLGVGKLTRDEIKSIKSRRCLSEKGALLIWAIAVICSTTSWLYLRWGRHYMPIVAFSIILMGIGVVFLLELVGRGLVLLKLRISRS